MSKLGWVLSINHFVCNNFHFKNALFNRSRAIRLRKVDYLNRSFIINGQNFQ